MSEPAPNLPPESKSLWYYADASNETVGPIQFSELQRLAAGGVIHSETQVVENGGTEWKRFSSVVSPPPRAETHPAPPDITPSSTAGPVNQSGNGALPKREVIAAFVLLGIFLAYKFATYEPGGRSPEGTTAPSGKTPEELAKSDRIITDIQSAPSEYGLVFLDSGHFPRGNDINAARIRFLLKAISEKTGDSREKIADTASRATGVIKADYGRIVTNQKFLEQAYQYYETGAPRESIAKIAPLLVVQMRH